MPPASSEGRVPLELEPQEPDPERIVDQILDAAEAWLKGQREQHRPRGRPLERMEAESFNGYFDDALLNSIRVVEVEKIDNPEFFNMLPDIPLPVPFDYSAEPSLTVIDTILVVKSKVPPGEWLSILFQECVHVQQFQLLGAYRMSARYLHGLIVNGFNYREVPMEKQAYDLQMRFDAGLRPFSVKAEVEAALRRDLI